MPAASAAAARRAGRQSRRDIDMHPIVTHHARCLAAGVVGATAAVPIAAFSNRRCSAHVIWGRAAFILEGLNSPTKRGPPSASLHAL
jgi:hypothetical protein